MPDRAVEIAHLLLREGALRNHSDDAHRDLYDELTGNDVLKQDVRDRLAAVGYELHEDLGWLGVRIAEDAESAGSGRNRMGVDARHVRLIVYFWVHLVYRQWLQVKRGLESRAPGAEQGGLFAGDDPDDEVPWMALSKVQADFAEVTKLSAFKGLLRTLQRLRFIRYDERRDRVWADASLFVLVDRPRMEDFVIELARSQGSGDPAAAVTAVATRAGTGAQGTSVGATANAGEGEA